MHYLFTYKKNKKLILYNILPKNSKKTIILEEEKFNI